MYKYLLGIDNGGTLIKAAIYDMRGKEIAVASCKTELLMPYPGFTERNMNEMWMANVKAIKEVIEKSGINPKDISGVATTGHGNGMYLVGDDGKPAYNGIISTDSRANSYIDKWRKEGVFDEILPITMQSVWAGQPAALLAWFRDNNKEVIERTKYVFMCKDFIRYMLTGEAYAEITDISGSNLMNVRDVKYDLDLLKIFGLEYIMPKLPPIKYSTEVCGYITDEVAELTGLEKRTPVAGGLFDIDASAIATGITEEDQLCLVAGTWSINEYISKKPVIQKDLFMTSLYCMEGHWLITEASPTSASNLEWFVGQFIDELEKGGKSSYEYCNELVEGTSPEECNIVFLPFLFGSNVGLDAKSAFIGINGWHSKAHILRALYEGVVYSHRYHIEKLLELREKPKSIRMAGGVVKSKVWVQMFADILQTPIEVTTSTELGALGAAICAGVAGGVFESFDEAASSMVDIGYVCRPNEFKKEIYDKKYKLYLETIKSLSSLWSKF